MSIVPFDYSKIAGTDQQEREYYLRRITEVFPERLEDSSLIYGNPKLEFFRLANDGLIPFGETGPRGFPGLKGDKGDKGDGILSIRDFGAVCDGVTDDSPAINRAVTSAIAQKRVLTFPNETIKIGSQFKLPVGLHVHSMKATLLYDYASNHAVYFMGENVLTGTLNVVLTKSDSRGVAIMGKDVDIENLSVSGDGVLTDSISNHTVGAYIEAENVTIKTLTTYGFRNHFNIIRSKNIRVAEVFGTLYRRGIWIHSSSNIHFGMGHYKGSSAPTGETGMDAILLESSETIATEDIFISNFIGENSPVSCFRLGGAYTIRNVHFNNVKALNTNGNGFKILGHVGQLHENIFLNDCVAEDCGQDSGNRNGFEVQLARQVKITNPVVRRRAKTFSAFNGIRVTGCEDVSVLTPSVQDTAEAGIVIDSQLGSNGEVTVLSPRVTRSGTHSVELMYTSINMQDVRILNGTYKSAGLFHVKAINVSGGGNRRAKLTFTTDQTTGQLMDGTTTSILMEIEAGYAPIGTPANGSTWVDTSVGKRYVRKANVWTEV